MARTGHRHRSSLRTHRRAQPAAVAPVNAHTHSEHRASPGIATTAVIMLTGAWNEGDPTTPEHQAITPPVPMDAPVDQIIASQVGDPVTCGEHVQRCVEGAVRRVTRYVNCQAVAEGRLSQVAETIGDTRTTIHVWLTS
jgi:hypothetical protein